MSRIQTASKGEEGDEDSRSSHVLKTIHPLLLRPEYPRDYPMKKTQNKGEGNMGKIQPSIIWFNVDAAGPRRVRASNDSRAATKSKPSLARLLENQSGCLSFRNEQMLSYKPAIISPSPRTGSKNQYVNSVSNPQFYEMWYAPCRTKRQPT